MEKPSFIIKGTEYFFNEVTLRHYHTLQELLRFELPDSEFRVAELVTKCPVEDLKKLRYQDWLLVWVNVQKQITPQWDGADNIQSVIKFGNQKFSLPRIEDMTAGEFIDLDIIFASPNAEKRLNEVAAILYRPIIGYKGSIPILEEYDNLGTQARAEIFMDLPMSAIRSANSFFTQSADSLLKNTLGSLEMTSLWTEINPEDQAKLKSLLTQDLGGSSSTVLLQTILSSLTQSQNFQSEHSSTGWLGEKMKSLKQTLRRKKPIVEQ